MLQKYDDCFRCHCCNGLPDTGMVQALVDLLNEAGITAEEINCAYRCEKHDAEVGGCNGQHPKGTAADVDASKTGVEILARVFEGLQADGVGRYFDENFVHVDVRDGRKDGGYRW